MKAYPILILAYRRTKELELVLESIEQLKPSVVYFHIHGSNDKIEQEEVNEVKTLIGSYKGKKEIKYSPEPLGVRTSMYSALAWISEVEKTFFVIEDDIVLRKNSVKTLAKYMPALEKEGGVFKFGQYRGYPVYWGWATTSETAKKLIDKAVWELPEDIVMPHFQDSFHYKGTMELHRRGQYHAWDDEFGLVTKIFGIKEIHSKEQLTDHIGFVSTREGNNIDKLFGVGTHVTFRNGVLVPQENENI